MKFKTNAFNESPRDVAHLTLLSLVTLGAGVLSAKPAWLLAWILACAVFGAGLLWLAGRGAASSQERQRARVFALKTLVNVFMNVSFATAPMLGVVFFLETLHAFDGDWWAALQDFGPEAVLGLKLSVVLAIALAFNRFHYFSKHLIPVGWLASDGHVQRRYHLSAGPAVAAAALTKYLERLQLPGTPKLNRNAISMETRVRPLGDGDASAYELTWQYAGCGANIRLEPASGNGTQLTLTFYLRNGFYRLEAFINPVDVDIIAGYLEAHLIGPMRSELALSSAAEKQDALRTQALEYQLRVLQAQIEPHFLFNTLANVRHLYRSNTDAGEEMMDHLIAYLRSTLEELRSEESTVGKEMELARHYLAIMKIRMGDRLSYGFVVPDSLMQHRFPPAMLISLVENAIKHGLRDQADGRLTITCHREAEHIRLSVADNGAGFSSVEGTGVGLSNIRQRLEAMHGSRAWLEVGAESGAGFVSHIVVPFERMA